jgi:uncharacterized membrane protein
MIELLKRFAEYAGVAVEIAGILIILIGLVFATGSAGLRLAREGRMAAYHDYRHLVGRSILLGLEFLVAGDIIRTVAVEPTLQSLAVLGGIVLIRTFLSMTLEVELEGRWPWQQRRSPSERG